jgi:RNase P/RNase MRP subunit p30
MQAILTDAVMQPDQKVEVLIQVFGIPEENARKMVGKTPNQQAA